MDGVHDLGGKAGFGPVEVEADEPVFHEPWERRVFGLNATAFVNGWVGGSFRHGIERMDPAHYLASSYYEHWLTGLATLLVENGVVDGDELVARAGSFPLSGPVASHVVLGDATAPETPIYAVGDAVRARNVQSKGHTRCPAYVRGRAGTVVRVNGAEPVPELHAHTGQQVLETCYGVRFEPSELWGDDAEDGAPVYIDLMERYLEET